MLSHAKYCNYLIWFLDGMGVCLDIIRWELFPLLFSYEKRLCEEIGSCWKKKLGFCFDYCCVVGYIEIVKWLHGRREINSQKNHGRRKLYHLNEKYSRSSTFIISSQNIEVERGFYYSCVYGHLNIAKWLWAVSSHEITTDKIRYNFEDVCRNGHVDIAKLLWRLNKKDIDISKGNTILSQNIDPYEIINDICWGYSQAMIDINTSIFEGKCNCYRDRDHTDVVKFLWEEYLSEH